MIEEYLEKHYNANKLYNSYLINTDNIDSAFSELRNFISSKILTNSGIDGNPDYKCVKREDATTKNISIDQIRQLQNFLYKSSVISGKKIAVIYEADQMNQNSANSCLKILEDTPNNTHIFLLTENASAILPTIRSRCAKITHHYDSTDRYQIEGKFVEPLIQSFPLEERVKFIMSFGKKDRNLWSSFSASVEGVMAKLCINSIDSKVALTELEMQLLSQFNLATPEYLRDKYDQVQKFIEHTNNYDLDLRASCIVLIEKFRR